MVIERFFLATMKKISGEIFHLHVECLHGFPIDSQFRTSRLVRR